MIVLNPDLLWEEEKEPPVPLAPKDAERVRAPGAPPAQADPLATRLQRTAGNAALAREAEAAGVAATAKPATAPTGAAAPATVRRAAQAPAAARTPSAPEVRDRDEARAPGARSAMTKRPVAPAAAKRASEPPATGRQEESTLAAAARKPAPPGTTPETEAEARAAALASALDRALAAFATDPEAADLLGLARLVEGGPTALARAAAEALARAVMRSDVEHRAAIARRLALDLKPHPDLRLARLLAGLMAGVMASPPAPAPAPPPPPPPA